MTHRDRSAYKTLSSVKAVCKSVTITGMTGHVRRNTHYTEEFKIEAVKQVVERGHRVAEVAERLGVSGHSLYNWIKRYDKPVEQRQEDDDLQAENRRLKAELKRVSEERDILKKATAYFARESD